MRMLSDPKRQVEKARDQAEKLVTNIVLEVKEQARANAEIGMRSSASVFNPPMVSANMISQEDLVAMVAKSLQDHGLKVFTEIRMKDRSNIPEFYVRVEW